MAIDERSRHAMFTKLQELMGEENAAILMEHLPPVGWADVATKRDIEALRSATKADLLEALHAQTRAMVTWLLTAMSVSTLTVGALAFAAAQLV
jgi:hypothetical protein